MIHSDAELQQNLELMVGMYRALLDLHQRVAPQNFQNYLVFAEGPIDEIRKLQREIDEYLGIADPVTAVNRS
jgi:hypothetical protein